MKREECPKCYDTCIEFQHAQAAEPLTYTATAKWCDCPLAKRYIASLRQLGQSPAVLKYKLYLIERDFTE